MSTRKARSDSKLDALPEEQRLGLRDGLLEGWKYDDALSWLETECGVRSSLSSLSAFYQRHCAPVLRDRRRLAALKAEALGEEAGKTDWDTASIELLKQVAFEAMGNPDSDPKDVERLFKLLLKARSLDQDERKLELLEAKAKQADEAEAIAGNADLSEEERAQRIKEIFGIG